MKNDRVLRVLRPSLALTALAIAVVLLGLAIAGPARAVKSASPKPSRSGASVVLQRGSEVTWGDDVVVPRGTTTASVVVFDGNVTVNGRVRDAVVAFGGDIVVNGTVGTSIVAFGGDVTLGPRAVAGRDLDSSEASLVLFGGELHRAPGARVVGQTQSFDGAGWSDAVGWAAGELVVNPFWGLSLVGWIVQTAFFLILALVAAALMPKQLRAVHRNLGRKPWASLGWGALTFLVVVPAILIVFVISIIGLLLVLPYALFVVLAYFFVTTGVASYVAQRVIRGFGGKENLMLAVTLGVVGTTVASRIPVAGPLVLIAMMVFGTGAAILGFAEWRGAHREQAAAQAAAKAAAAAAAGASADTPLQGGAITPIVQTAPPQAPAGAQTPPPAGAQTAPPQPPVGAQTAATIAAAQPAGAATQVTTAPAPQQTPATEALASEQTSVTEAPLDGEVGAPATSAAEPPAAEKTPGATTAETPDTIQAPQEPQAPASPEPEAPSAPPAPEGPSPGPDAKGV